MTTDLQTTALLTIHNASSRHNYLTERTGRVKSQLLKTTFLFILGSVQSILRHRHIRLTGISFFVKLIAAAQYKGHDAGHLQVK